MIKCERCGRANREQRRYCAACGNQLGWRCVRCGFFNLQDENHCGGCGVSGVAGPADETSAAPSNAGTQAGFQSDEQPKEPDFPVASPIQTDQAPPANRKELIESVVHNEIEKMKQKIDVSDNTNAVSQDDIDKLFE